MDVQYFIDKFEAIPEEKWCVGVLHDGSGRRCANGHCGVINMDERSLTIESRALYQVFKHLNVRSERGIRLEDSALNIHYQYSQIAAYVNNGKAFEYQQYTPKQRILAALRDLQVTEDSDNAVEAVKEILNSPRVLTKPINKPVSNIMESVFAGAIVAIQTITAALLIT